MRKISIFITSIFLIGCATTAPKVSEYDFRIQEIDNDTVITLESVYAWPISEPRHYTLFIAEKKTDRKYSLIRHKEVNGTKYSAHSEGNGLADVQLSDDHFNSNVNKFSGSTSGDISPLLSLNIPDAFKVGDSWQSTYRGPGNIVDYHAEAIELCESIPSIRISMKGSEITATYWVTPNVGIIKVISKEKNRDEMTFVRENIKPFEPEILELNEYETALVGLWQAHFTGRDFRISFKDNSEGRVSVLENDFNKNKFTFKADVDTLSLKFNDYEESIPYKIEKGILEIDWSKGTFHKGYGFIEGLTFYNYAGSPNTTKDDLRELDRSGFITTVWVNQNIDYDSVKSDFSDEYSIIDGILSDQKKSDTTFKQWFEGMKIGYSYPDFVSYFTWLCTTRNLTGSEIEKGMGEFIDFFNENYMENKDVYRFRGKYISFADIIGRDDYVELFILSDPIAESFQYAFNHTIEEKDSFFVFYTDPRK